MKAKAVAAWLCLAPLVGAGSLAATPAALPAAVRPAEGDNVRRTIWSFGITGLRHNLKSAGGGEFLGEAGAVQIGTGYISDKWFAAGSYDILLGPYEPTLDRQLDTDFGGSGVTVWLGLSAQASNLRSAAGGYGFALGMSYSDVTGRSNGVNRRAGPTESGPEGIQIVDQYTNHVTELALLPAVFFSWLSPPRPRGNTPELLATRIEGYVLLIGAAMPLMANYSSVETRRNPDLTTAGAPVTASGDLWGYSLLVSLQTMLGI